jgi:peptidoglycan/LPS O-acetylase OafA/YrhL
MRRVPALDGLRGIAIMLVVAFHGWKIEGGVLGVDLFFVLSGFLITMLLLQERSRTGTVGLRSFYRRRVVRLLPALGLLVVTVTAVEIARGNPVGTELGAAALAASYSLNLVQVLQPAVVPDNFRHLWTLAAEEQFYLVWPLVLVWLCARGRPRLVLLGLLGALIVSLADLYLVAPRAGMRFWPYYGPDTHGSPLIIGCIAAVLYSRGIRVPSSIAWTGLAGAIIVTVGESPASNLPSWTPTLFPFFAFCAATVVMHAASSETWVTRVLSIRPLVWAGWISYGLYLWNSVLLRAGFRWTIIPVLLAVSIAFASWRYLEQPLIRRYSRQVRPKLEEDAPLRPVRPRGGEPIHGREALAESGDWPGAVQPSRLTH